MDKLRSLTSLSEIFADSSRPSYVVRVRGPGVGPGPWPWPGINFLWGSGNISVPPSFDKPVILHIRNLVSGEDVTIGTLTGPLTTGVQTAIGVLQPGDCLSIQIQGFSAIYATCVAGLETLVGCLQNSSR
ncbi:hypothetical protein [Sapientia aquatica]|uniref:Uncharacterized protein n=1 Tax=Sapientia aquatica TaxID=1549640 RepID=A0A4R5VLL8_9BURK|nr:hypothetical protein [Sapientia aquatica]TDK58967.1 hypothetical protein E2I14_19085 [Sapientia aquatica]